MGGEWGHCYDEERDNHFRGFVVEDNNYVVYYDKFLVHAKLWYFYMNKKPFMIKGVYYMEVSGSDGKKIVWEMVEYHFIND